MEPEGAAALEARGVCFTYPDGTRALHHVDFSVASGEFVAMLAANGSGKTTLLKVLVGLLRPDEGQVRVAGRDLRALPAHELFGQVGVVFQNPDDQLFAPTVAEDVAFGPRNLDLDAAEVERRVAEALDAVGATPLRARAVHHLSFGERKRVCVAGVLAMRPSVLVLDEPTAGLDPAGEAAMLHTLRDLNRHRGITVVLATHSVDMLPLFAHRIYVLSQGRVLREGTSEAIFCDQEMLERASLRLPYVSRLLYEMKRFDGVPIAGLPLTVGEARKRLLEFIPEELLLRELVSSCASKEEHS